MSLPEGLYQNVQLQSPVLSRENIAVAVVQSLERNLSNCGGHSIQNPHQIYSRFRALQIASGTCQETWTMIHLPEQIGRKDYRASSQLQGRPGCHHVILSNHPSSQRPNLMSDLVLTPFSSIQQIILLKLNLTHITSLFSSNCQSATPITDHLPSEFTVHSLKTNIKRNTSQ